MTIRASSGSLAAGKQRPRPRGLAAEALQELARSGGGTIRATGAPFAYRIGVLETSEDLRSLLPLQEAILAVAPRPLPLYVRDEAFFHRCVASGGCVVGAWVERRVVGYALLLVPEPGEDNYGVDVGLPSTEIPHVAHLAGSGVHPDFRGNGLQRQLVEVRGRYAAAAGYHHLCGEVLPNNAISIQNHLARGYRIKGCQVDRFGLDVFLLHRDVRLSPPGGGDDVRECRLHDAGAVRQMLAQGRSGFQLERRAEGWYLLFSRSD